MRLSIVIPAFNEENAIGSTIERSLDARAAIMTRAAITGVEIIVVSDGSTDRTAEIARSFAEAKVLEFKKNRGYGAAIKKGFESGDAELVGFLDADGTCDPEFFADLCAALIQEGADVAIGSRMGPKSRMPKIRRLGNRIYALILSVLSNKIVTDTASGMRVIRRSSLPRLYPLPDGMHFTPAISARTLMDDSLRLIELPMPYEERIGESKLHVFRDGVRFLRTIFEMSLMWRPAKMFASSALICLALMTILALHPLELWLTERRLQEDMIYRLLFCSFVGSVGVNLLSVSILCEHMARLWNERTREPTFVSSMLAKTYTLRGFSIGVLVCVPMLTWLIGPGARTLFSRGVVEIHWSRVVLAGLITFALCQMFVTVLVLNLVRFHAARGVRTTREASSALIRAAEKIRPSHSRSHAGADERRVSQPTPCETLTIALSSPKGGVVT